MQVDQNNFTKTFAKMIVIHEAHYIEVTLPILKLKFYFNVDHMNRLQRERARMNYVRLMRHMEVMQNV